MAVQTKRRLRETVKRLVIEAGFLEHADPEGKSLYLRLAKGSINFAVDLLNKCLEEQEGS